MYIEKRYVKEVITEWEYKNRLQTVKKFDTMEAKPAFVEEVAKAFDLELGQVEDWRHTKYSEIAIGKDFIVYNEIYNMTIRVSVVQEVEE